MAVLTREKNIYNEEKINVPMILPLLNKESVNDDNSLTLGVESSKEKSIEFLNAEISLTYRQKSIKNKFDNSLSLALSGLRKKSTKEKGNKISPEDAFNIVFQSNKNFWNEIETYRAEQAEDFLEDET